MKYKYSSTFHQSLSVKINIHEFSPISEYNDKFGFSKIYPFNILSIILICRCVDNRKTQYMFENSLSRLKEIKMETKRMCDYQHDILMNTSKSNLQSQSTAIKLKYFKILLAKTFDCVSIHETISRHGVPFLHVWKPISRLEGVQGMDFLPCFHIIVTIVTNEERSCKKALSTDQIKDESVLFQLYSFHGKVLAEEVHLLSQCNTSTTYDLMTKMARDELQLCHGVDEVDKKQLMKFIQTCDMPVLNKFKSIFLIEQFMGTILVRSRLCKFVLYKDTPTQDKIKIVDAGANGWECCKECSSFQVNDNSSISGKDNLPNCNTGQVEETNETVAQNTFYKVFSQTSIFDMKSLDVMQNASDTSCYPKPSSQLIQIKQELQVSSKNTIDDRHGTNIKSESPREMMAYDMKSTEFPPSNENTTPLIDPSLSYQGGYQLPVNEFLSNYNDSSDLYINPPLDMDDIHSHRNFPLEYDPQLGSSNNLAIDHFLNNSTCDPIYAKPRHKKKRRTNKRSEKTDDLGIQLNYPIENVLENMQFGIENKIHSVKDKRLRKKLQKLKREKTIQDGGLGVMSKKEFRKTCMICLYEFQSEGNYQTDQLRHQQSFGDLDQPVSCPICHER